MKIVVLGAGLVGNVIARDLAEDKSVKVSIVDFNQEILDKLTHDFDLQGICADLSNPNIIKDIVKDYDLVIGALPGFMGYQALKAVIEAGKNIVDISFFEEDPFSLDELAKEKGVTAVVDCGVAPGSSNIILGYVDSILDKTESFLCYVGGLPVERDWPFEYKAPFSPSDVIEEYLRLARYIENSEIVVKPALSEPELLDFPEVGTLEAFNTDGLRSLIQTMDIPFMKEKTLRYPGHIEKMRMLRETGFFDKEEIDVNGIKIKPIELTSKLLFEQWKLEEGEEDLTVMKIIIEGIKEGKNLRYTYEMLDKYDREKRVISMARTTGYTCTAVARILLEEKFNKKGIIPPEILGKDSEVYHQVIEDLWKRNVIIKETVEEL
ncbi:MAG: saccharopine dehydrogenase NADP-binding domain-containing protein [Candidatus Heimdallarchaeota archaeon]|nr:saccharopine dehydrogenase NADP-binding domain-containing protein [Candidatus Heimdallarchaeota archaeon]MCK4769734.1 saccharopine dehydrogenase NADP-binding domain-containing protein [Candidatus Heimdallarchaeota archaeon]